MSAEIPWLSVSCNIAARLIAKPSDAKIATVRKPFGALSLRCDRRIAAEKTIAINRLRAMRVLIPLPKTAKMIKMDTKNAARYRWVLRASDFMILRRRWQLVLRSTCQLNPL